MKINICLFLVSLFVSIQVKSAELTIRILNIDEKIGFIHFAIYDNPEFFPKNEGKKLGFKEEVKNLINNEIIIGDLEESYYAVAIYHDKNSNDEFDSFLSIPQEKFGFSNDAKVFLGPPSFDESSFYSKKNQNKGIGLCLD